MKQLVAIATLLVIPTLSYPNNETKPNEANVSRETYQPVTLCRVLENCDRMGVASANYATYGGWGVAAREQTELQSIRKKKEVLKSVLRLVEKDAQTHEKASRGTFGISIAALTMLILGQNLAPKIFPVLGFIYMASLIALGLGIFYLAYKESKNKGFASRALLMTLATVTGLGFGALGVTLGFMDMAGLGFGVTAILALGGLFIGISNDIRNLKARDGAAKIKEEISDLENEEKQKTGEQKNGWFI